MKPRYYPSTRERIARALNEGVKAGVANDELSAMQSGYSRWNSGRPLHRAFYRGWWLANNVDPFPRQLPVVDLSAEFSDVIREVENDSGFGLFPNMGEEAK